MLAQSDPVLDRFDRLGIREVEDRDDNTASFLAKFQSAAASLEPDGRIKLEMVYAHEDVKLLKAALADPQASKIGFLHWEYQGKEDVNSIIPLLINNCSELTSLQVEFGHHSAFDFVSKVLEHPRNKIKVLEMPPYTEGDAARFFTALGQSQVSALIINDCNSSEFCQYLYEYLTRDLLVRLSVISNEVSSQMISSLANCIRLTELTLISCAFYLPFVLARLPKCITKLDLDSCMLFGSFDWSFLVNGSGVRELDFSFLVGVDGNQLGSALAVYLGAKGLERLCIRNCHFVNEALAAIGMEIGRIKQLMLKCSLNDASIELISLLLQSSDSELRELVFPYNSHMMTGIENHLMPALKHPNCNLTKLILFVHQPGHQTAAKTIEDNFRNYRALFVLLQGQQMKKLYCPLRRLPVEMFRLVGKVLV
ncbi:hypothetical protein BASA81_012497 [Batrachochytrium salamandrivorans]|nr:hypothetical protein BASA81_012497 [Batrachochytrium salamandrivorans]